MATTIIGVSLAQTGPSPTRRGGSAIIGRCASGAAPRRPGVLMLMLLVLLLVPLGPL
jgi:hypothetical protein